MLAKTKINRLLKKKLSDPTIAGTVIESSIAQMASLGAIGKLVLREQGVAEIDPRKQYNYKLRSAIHQAAFERFGDAALYFFGLTQVEKMQGVLKDLYSGMSKFMEENREELDSPNMNIANDALDKCITEQMRITGNMIADATVGGDGKYGATCNALGDGKYLISQTRAALLPHYEFDRASLVAALVLFHSKTWRIAVIFDPEQSSSGDGWATCVYQVKFERQLSSTSMGETFANLKLEARDELLKAVLRYSENQTKELEAQKYKLENLSSKLGKYVPPQIHEALFAGDYDTEITTRRKKLTIFFSDIVNFTSTSEELQPEDLTKYLNEYFSQMTQIALDCGATIDKYIGDAMMVFFGDPETKGEREDARACVTMALRMQERMAMLQTKWSNEGFANPFQVRMGINTGYCNVGNFGSDQRLTYTIIGGEVNVAQRLEAGADANGILMSFETYAHAQDLIEVEERNAIKMKGISREIKVLAVRKRKNKTKNKNNEASEMSNSVELSEIEILKNDMNSVKSEIKSINNNIHSILKKI